MNRRRLFVERPGLTSFRTARWARAQLVLAVCLACLHRAVECGGAWNSRRLLQDGNACTAANCTSNNEAVHVVELDLVDKECVVMRDAWFDGPAIPPSKGGGVLQLSSPLECCKACFDDKRCSVWTYCSQPRGCLLEGPSGTRQLPAGGCRLVTLPNFHPIVNSSTSFRVVGPDVPFMSGAPVTLTLPKVPHYHINPGVDLNNNFDYRCPTLSLRSDVCEVVGSAQDLARMCDADQQCKAFVYLPGGLDFKSAPVGVLKGGIGVDTIPLSALAVNPSTALFMKDTVAYGTPSSAGSGGSKNLAVYIVVPIAAVVAVTGLALLGLVAWRLRSQKVASSDRQPAVDLAAAGAGEWKGPPSAGVGPNQSLQHTHSQQRQQQQQQPGVQLPRDAALASSRESRTGGAATTWTAAGWQPGFGGKGPSRLGRDDSALEGPPPEDGIKSGASKAVPPADWPWLLLAAAVQQQQQQRRQTAASLQQQQQQPRYQWDAPDSPVARALLRRFGEEAGSSSEGATTGSSGPSSLTPSQEQHSLSSDGGSLGSAPGEVGQQPQQQQQPDWVIQPEQVDICRRPDGSWWQLGSGVLGTVYKGLLHGVQPVAVKVLPHNQADPRLTEDFVREITLLKSCRDRNIVQFLGANLEGPAAMLVTEFLELGDLWRALPLRNSAGDRIFSWHRRGRRVALDVARGLHYLHHKRVVHLDLKSPNILLSRHGTAKLADVGVARVLTRGGSVSVHGSMAAGSLAWSAPEVLTGRRCCEAVDVYSFGIVLWEICTGEVPVRGGMRPLSVPGDCPQPVADLQARCTAEDPSQRPSAAELVGLLSALQ